MPGSAIMPRMDLAPSERAAALRDDMLAFMDSHVYPAEPVYERQIVEGGDPHLLPPVVEELKAEARRGGRGGKTDGEADVLAKIAEMKGAERAMAERLHAIVKSSAPALAPKTWYGMPAYARDGKVVCFVQAADKFKARYATLGFSDEAKLDDGSLWPTSFALKEWTPAVESKVEALLRKAVG